MKEEDLKSQGQYPAFPHDQSSNTFSGNGITIRDYFAGKALTGLCHCESNDDPDGWNHDKLSRCAYKLADAMLKARE